MIKLPSPFLFFRVLVLVLGSQVLVACQTLKDVDRTLFEITEAAAPRDRVTGERTLRFDGREEQIRKGNAIIETELRNHRANGYPLNADVDPEAYERLQKITAGILSVSHFADEEWTVVLLPNEQFNAFVTGGTYIVVFKGLVDQLRSDDELAAVIGHEIAHVAAGHISEGSAHRAVFGLARRKATSRDGYSEAFTNLNEQEADRIGVMYAALAGYDPYAASRIWFRKSKESPIAWNYFRTHPASDDRTISTKNYAAKAERYYTHREINPEYLSLLECNAIWCRDESQLQAGEGGGLLSFLETGLNAYGDHLKTETERLRQQNEILAEATRQRYGIPSPPDGSAVALNPTTELIWLNRVYRGQINYYGRNKSGDIVTEFSLDPEGKLVGRYVEIVRGRQIPGTMRLVREISKNRYEFEWKNGDLTGTARLRFTQYGTFRGHWEFQYRGERWSGSWNGKAG